MFIEGLKLKGVYTFRYEDGREIIYENVITDAFKDALFRFLDYSVSTPSANELNLTHLAVGEGTASAKKTDVKLTDEIFRKPFSFKGKGAVFSTECLITAAEGNPAGDYIKEVAVFANATGAKDSGLMISRANVNVLKVTSLAITITWKMEVV